MNRVTKPGGYFAIMTGNELFDMFALNSGTADFFLKHFNQPDAAKMLSESTSERFYNADRRNPLNFKFELGIYGFNEIYQTFSQWHKKLPMVSIQENNGDLLAAHAASRDHKFDPNLLPEKDQWKSLFLCSLFGSLSIKI